MKRLLLITAALLALTGAADAGDRLPAVYLGQWCEGRDGSYSAMKRGEECVIEPLIMKPNKFLATELECRFRSIKKTSERYAMEIVAYCRAEDERRGYVEKLRLIYSKGTLQIKSEDRDHVANTAEQADPKIIAALKKRFPTIAEDNVWMDLTGGHKCGGCPLVWFETDRANWACNIYFADVVKIKNCWKRHA
jgi:hypothetical protein